jgi:hypothetical protein
VLSSSGPIQITAAENIPLGRHAVTRPFAALQHKKTFQVEKTSDPPRVFVVQCNMIPKSGPE